MQDDANLFRPPLSDLSLKDWTQAMRKLGRQYGMYEELGQQHAALFVDDGPTLLVTFEAVEHIRNTYESGEPVGFELVREAGWSHLCLLTSADTWFRDAAVYEFFDKLSDDGFFDAYDRVIFYGADMCGYAAAAFSVASPGATVICLQPQATLNPRITGWDKRFAPHRRLSFEDRYGYAPDMIDAAEDVFVLYDPSVRDEFAQAALFHKAHTTMVPLRHMSGDLEADLIEMQVLYRMLAQAGTGKLNRQSLHKLMRLRRKHVPFLRRAVLAVEAQEKPMRLAKLCRAIGQHYRMPIARRRLSALMDKGIALPDPLRPPR